MERNHKRAKSPGLNLVAFMDIFTILVFFLLINSSSTQQLPSNKNLKLPVSISDKTPEETWVIEITRTDILVQGVKVAVIDEVLKNHEDSIAKLKDELIALSSNEQAQTGVKKESKITVIGDENIPYDLIKKILTTCQQANFTKIAFAAMQNSKPKDH
jgi:biopolymer transport protein ExbD